MSEDRPTRMVRARDLTKGDVLLMECRAGRDCRWGVKKHDASTSYAQHELTVLDAEKVDEIVSFIVVTETGEQQEYQLQTWLPQRVYAD